MNKEHIEEVFSDEAFVKSLFNSKSYEDAQRLLADKDIDFSIDEIRQIVKVLKEHPNGPITEDQLEGISGGTEFCCIVFGCVLGGVMAGSLGLTFTNT